MKAQEIRQMSDEEIRSVLEDAKAELLNLRFQQSAGKLEDLSRLGVVRKNIARFYTVLRERQLAAALVHQEGDDHAE